MTTLNKYVENIEKWVCTTSLAIMLLLTFVNVVSRFVLHMSLSFSEEIVTNLFVLASLAGSSMAIANGTHLGLDYITSFMPKTMQRMLAVMTNMLGIILACLIVYFGIHMVIDEFVSKQLSATMQWPEWIYGMAVPCGAALLIFRYCYAIFLLLREQSGQIACTESTQ